MNRMIPQKTSKAIVIFITAASNNEAKKIGHILIEENLIACCNIVQSVESIFRWQGKLHSEQEVLMLCKTREELFGTIEKRVRQLHSYEVPEIIAMPITQGSEDYLNWIVKETKPDQETRDK